MVPVVLASVVDEDLWTHHPTRPTEARDRLLRADVKMERKTEVELEEVYWDVSTKLAVFFFQARRSIDFE